MTKDYTRHDITDLIESMYEGNYPAQAGCLRATISSILISVELRDPDLFKEIMRFEMKTTGALKKKLLTE